MKSILGHCLREIRGGQSRLQFAKRLGLSYTFVREMELGNRLPSDEVLLSLATRLEVDFGRLVLYAYCDRSPALRSVLLTRDIAGLLAQASTDPEGKVESA
jgi:transcriptional regulator with XRE-family HTH domain